MYSRAAASTSWPKTADISRARKVSDGLDDHDPGHRQREPGQRRGRGAGRRPPGRPGRRGSAARPARRSPPARAGPAARPPAPVASAACSREEGHDRRAVGHRQPALGMPGRRRSSPAARRSRSRCRLPPGPQPVADRARRRRGQLRRHPRAAAACPPGLGRARAAGSRSVGHAGHPRPAASVVGRPARGDHAAVPGGAVRSSSSWRAVRRRPRRPDRNATRSAWCSSSGETVVTIVVRPRRYSASRSAIIASVWASTAEVGSTRTRISGSRGQRPGQHHPLPLAAGQAAAPLVEPALPAAGERRRRRPRPPPCSSAASACSRVSRPCGSIADCSVPANTWLAVSLTRIRSPDVGDRHVGQVDAARG